jgi:hypothetical protein
MNITLKNGPGIPKKAGRTILSPGEPGWSTDLQELYVGTSDPQIPAMVGKSDNHVNVRHHGAKGDGVTNDEPAIQAATAEAVKRGVSVFFPKGTYSVRGSSFRPTTPHDVRWFGENEKETVITGSPSGRQFTFRDDTPPFKLAFENMTINTRIVQCMSHPPEFEGAQAYAHRCTISRKGSIRVADGLRTALAIRCTTSSNGIFTVAPSFANSSVNYACIFTGGGHISPQPNCYTKYDNCTFSSSGATGSTANGMIYIDKSDVTFSDCLFLFDKDQAYNHCIEFSQGSLNVRHCILRLDAAHPATTAFVSVKYSLGISNDMFRHLRYEGIVLAKPTDTAWKHVELVGPARIVPSRIVTNSPKAQSNIVGQTSCYEHHTDGIWWNGTKITP